MTRFSRLQSMIGAEALQKLQNSCVAIFGLGGVGGYVAEGLARSGVGNFVLVDDDVIKESNVNRQVLALSSTIGRLKTEVARDRILDINPSAKLIIFSQRFTKESQEAFCLDNVNYIVDAIDSVDSKVALVCLANKNNIPILCCGGTGNRQSTSFSVKDIFSLQNDRLARSFRHKLRIAGVTTLPIVCSNAPTICKGCTDEQGHTVPSTIAYTPAIAGMVIVQEVINKIIL